ncbi:peroxiredoxin [Thermomonospora umbrina]|uniref:Alkyl hydroperoxide reductase E n=1 Tax=Thermomonospora umbrina TaxID=111806 RepID=A0A3D9SHN2_9ACTN|nr:peroxiredoxin [Thermomonospora umbrina]REE95402.1 peroxiredoxin [Thermomonospora umbrina]
MAVEVGDVAPDFELADQHGVPFRLSGLRGAHHVLLVFYPLAFSGVCAGELRALRDGLTSLGPDTRVAAVSVDSMFALRAWADRDGFSFPLLSDFWPHGEVARAYGVFDDDRGTAARGTFVIDREGVVRWKVVNAISEPRAMDEYRKALATL